jgi:hypothetical protein
MVEKSITEAAFKLTCELIESINQKNFKNLEDNFNISPAVLEEIKEELFDYFETEKLPKLKILETHFEIFKYDTTEGFGIEATIFNLDNKETELTLHTEFYNNNLRFKLIEVM